MLIEMLKAVGDRQVGQRLNVADEIGRAYVDGGFAKAAGGDGGSTLDNFAETIQKAVASGFEAGAAAVQAKSVNHVRDAKVHQGEYTSPDVELKGLEVFGSRGGFLHVVREIGGGNPSEDAARKHNDWKTMQVKAGMVAETKGQGTPSGMSEGTDLDGGVLVIPEFSQQIYERSIQDQNFLAECDNTVVRGNTLALLGVDDNSRANGSRWGGIQGYWASEAEQFANASRPKFRTMDLRLKKLYVFAYITDELLADSSYALEQRVMKGAARELAFKTNDAMVNGNGGGLPQGIVGGTGTISVAKETGQAANTILINNIEKMWMRYNAFYRQGATWYINQDCEAALQLMAFPVGIAGSPIYQPVGGVSSPSYATLKGRPVKVIEFCSTLGTQGDIILTNWDSYTAITKGGVKTDVSMHVRFLYGEMAYRFTFRMDGQPLWDKSLTPYKGTTTTSTTVVLDTRA